jgi:hypothetical protein
MQHPFCSAGSGARYLAAFAVALCSVAAPAHASFHSSRIAELFLGTDAHPDAQYVRIRAYANNQPQFSTVQIRVFDATGSALPNFHTIVNNLPGNATNQQSILIATTAAQDMLGIVHDDDDGVGNNNPATGSLPLDGGLVCFSRGVTTPDCVSYGNYTGTTTVGGSEAGPPGPLAPSGWAVLRDLGADDTLQSTDDTNDSSVDLFLGGPGATSFDQTTVSDLRVSVVADVVTLTWTNSGPTTQFLIHRDGAAGSVHASAALDFANTSSWDDPDSASGTPDLAFYVVKP